MLIFLLIFLTAAPARESRLERTTAGSSCKYLPGQLRKQGAYSARCSSLCSSRSLLDIGIHLRKWCSLFGTETRTALRVCSAEAITVVLPACQPQEKVDACVNLGSHFGLALCVREEPRTWVVNVVVRPARPGDDGSGLTAFAAKTPTRTPSCSLFDHF
jgi:hypothetical protein